MADELQQSGQDQLANLLFEVKTEPPSTFSVGHKAKVISKALVPPTVSKKKACSQGKEDLVRLSERNDGMEKMHGFQMLLQAAELAEGIRCFAHTWAVPILERRVVKKMPESFVALTACMPIRSRKCSASRTSAFSALWTKRSIHNECCSNGDLLVSLLVELSIVQCW